MIDQLSIDTGNLNISISQNDKKDLVLRHCQTSTSSLDSWIYEMKTKNLKFEEKCVTRVSQTEEMTISLEGQVKINTVQPLICARPICERNFWS